MTFNEYQARAMAMAKYPDIGRNQIYPLLGIVGEVGEIFEKVKKEIRDGTEFERVDKIKEIGDVLWYISAVCYEWGIDLDTVAFKNLEKLESRSRRGVLGGSGDNR